MSVSSEQRGEYRIDSGEIVYIELEAADPDVALADPKILISHCVDISANGIQVIADEPLQCEAIHQVCIQLERPRCRLHMVAEVMWSRLLGDDEVGYSIGLRLYESQNTDIIQWKRVIAERCTG